MIMLQKHAKSVSASILSSDEKWVMVIHHVRSKGASKVLFDVSIQSGSVIALDDSAEKLSVFDLTAIAATNVEFTVHCFFGYGASSCRNQPSWVSWSHVPPSRFSAVLSLHLCPAPHVLNPHQLLWTSLKTSPRLSAH